MTPNKNNAMLGRYMDGLDDLFGIDNYNTQILPSISLKNSTVLADGNGTLENPYILAY